MSSAHGGLLYPYIICHSLTGNANILSHERFFQILFDLLVYFGILG